MNNYESKFKREYIMLEEKFGIDSKVFFDSFISDSRVNEIFGVCEVELPSASAVKGDAILDMIVLTSTNKINGDIIESKDSLNLIRTKYCGNERLAVLMKKSGFYNLIDVGNNLQSLNDQTAATCFEALIYNIFAHYNANSVDCFLDEIDFYTIDESKVKIESDKDLKTYLHNQINSIQAITTEDLLVESKLYRNMIHLFEETIKRIIQYHGYSGNDFESIMNYLASHYSINDLDNKNQKNFLSKFKHLVKRIDNLIIDIEQINKKDKRLIFENNELFIGRGYFESYKERYILGFLSNIYKSI